MSLRRALRAALAAFVIAGVGTGPVSAQGLIRDAEVEHTLDRLAEPILRAAGLAPDAVEIYMLADPRINAFVGTPRTMVLYTGLMRRWSSPEPLMGVIAHEVGHITGGHLARRAVASRNMSAAAQIGLVLAAAAAAAAGAPEVGAAVALGGGSALQRSFLAYSRAEEAAADQAGISYLNAAGVDPNGLLDVLAVFKGQEVFASNRIDPYAVTHPLSTERIGLMERRIAASPAAGRPTDPELAYWHARMQAKLDGFLERPERLLARLDTAAEPDSEANRIRRAVALHRLARTDDALAALAPVIAARPDDAFLLDLKGQFEMEAGRTEAAVATLRRAARLAREEPLIQAALGRALLASDAPGSDDEALRVLEQSIRADAAEPRALRDLAIAYSRAGRDGEAALATAERLALTRSFAEAGVLARRALGLLPEGSPDWLRADDIAHAAEQAARNR